MITVRHNKVILAVILTLICICLIPKTVDAQAIKTTVAEILSNPDKYDGKMVQVDGKVYSLKPTVSKRGNPYYTFSVKGVSNGALKVFSFGSPSVKNEDSVTVRGTYQKVKHVPPRFTFHNEIDASDGSVEKN